ncbi:MAG: amidohydrolase family protein [Planctomycetes bacterium]|nr:amidohydrolase family protein [Planctomycetota bacterium]
MPGLFLDPDSMETRGRLVRVAWVDGVITDVRPEDSSMTGSATDIDLDGRWLLPAFCESHAHLVYGSVRRRMIDLTVESPEGIAEHLSTRLDANWVLGAGWREEAYPDGGVGRADLRAAIDRAPESLCFFWSTDHHRALISRASARRLGLDASSTSTSVLLEEGDAFAAWEQIPLRSESIAEEMRDWLRHGVSSVSTFDRDASLRAVLAMEDRGELPLRVNHSIPLETLLTSGLEPRLPTLHSSPSSRPGIAVPWVKIFLDGTLGSQSAWLFEEYTDRPGWLGRGLLDDETRAAALSTIARSGLGVAIHAIGDRAVHEAARFILDLRARRRGELDVIDRIEHAELLRPELIELLARERICASVQPCHLLSDAALAPRRWGIERCRYVLPLRSLSRAGVAICFGTDAPVETRDPWVNLRAAVDRRPRGARDAWQAEERLDWPTAVRAATFGAAECNRLPRSWGRVVPGAPADLQVLEAPCDWTEIESIDGARWRATAVGGRWFADSSAEPFDALADGTMRLD